MPPQAASENTLDGRLEDDVPSQGASAGGDDSDGGMAAPPPVPGQGGREPPPAGGEGEEEEEDVNKLINNLSIDGFIFDFWNHYSSKILLKYNQKYFTLGNLKINHND